MSDLRLSYRGHDLAVRVSYLASQDRWHVTVVEETASVGRGSGQARSRAAAIARAVARTVVSIDGERGNPEVLMGVQEVSGREKCEVCGEPATVMVGSGSRGGRPGHRFAFCAAHAPDDPGALLAE